MKTQTRTSKGFTLIEMIMVLVIMSSVLLLITNYGTRRMDQFRRDKTALQMQQILSAAMAYYVSYGIWPTAAVPNTATTIATASKLSTSPLIPAFLPSIAGDMYPFANVNVKNSNTYLYWVTPSPAFSFVIAAPVPSQAEGTIVSGMLPNGQVVTDGTAAPGGFYATAQVNIPGQNLNNARAVNFAAIFLNGTCVPAPVCPGTMVPSIYVSPVSVNGVSDVPTCTGGPSTCTNVSVYPIQSFSAYAQGGGSAALGGSAGTPLNCAGTAGPSCGAPATDPTGTTYWRVCLKIITEKSAITAASGSNQEALEGSVLAITRCVPGSSGDVPIGNGY
jgi:prepilin-type N-terminal cleavage/methylation domain-containing protein